MKIMYSKNLVRDCQQITFIMLNRLCLLSKNSHSPVLKGQHQAGWNTSYKEVFLL